MIRSNHSVNYLTADSPGTLNIWEGVRGPLMDQGIPNLAKILAYMHGVTVPLKSIIDYHKTIQNCARSARLFGPLGTTSQN